MMLIVLFVSFFEQVNIIDWRVQEFIDDKEKCGRDGICTRTGKPPNSVQDYRVCCFRHSATESGNWADIKPARNL